MVAFAPSGRTLLAAALLAGMAAGSATDPALAQAKAKDGCDPYRTQVDAAIALLGQHKPQLASAQLMSVLAADKNNVGANYVLGLVKLSNTNGAADQEAGARQLALASTLIQKHPAPCAKSLGWYSIYVSLGAQQFNAKNITGAKQNFDIAYLHRADLAKSSRTILLYDMGNLYFSQGDLAKSLQYYSEGAKEGNQSSQQRADLVRQLIRRNP